MNRYLRCWVLPVCVAACVAGVSGGCSTNRPPTVTLEDARVIERTAEGMVIEVTLSGTNPNAEALPLKAIDYTLVLNGKTVFSGRRSPEATLSGEGTRTIRIPTPVALEAGAGGGEAAYSVSGVLTYIEPGKIAEILFDAEVSQPTVSFSGSGRVDLGARP